VELRQQQHQAEKLLPFPPSYDEKGALLERQHKNDGQMVADIYENIGKQDQHVLHLLGVDTPHPHHLQKSQTKSHDPFLQAN
jgi:hypothetical protein